MSNKIDMKTLEALQQGCHKAFEVVFLAYYGKVKAFIYGYVKSEPDAEELAEKFICKSLGETPGYRQYQIVRCFSAYDGKEFGNQLFEA